MHNIFYASGFLYHVPTQKILLQHTTTSKDFLFSLLTGKGSGNEDPAVVFQKVLSEELGIVIPLSDIHPVYDYATQDMQRKQYIFYAELGDPTAEKKFSEKSTVEWFTLKQITKLKLSEQTSHDIMIGQRVLRANNSTT